MYMKKYKNYIIDMCTILGCNAFIYFISQYIIKNYHLIGSALDQKIPFIIEFILVYSIWYPLVIFTMFLLYKYSKDKYNNTKRIRQGRTLCSTLPYSFELKLINKYIFL